MPGKSFAAMVAIILLVSILESLSQESRINRTCSISGWIFFLSLMLSVILGSALNTLRCLTLNVQYTCLASCQGSTIWKDIGEEERTSEDPVGNPSE